MKELKGEQLGYKKDIGHSLLLSLKNFHIFYLGSESKLIINFYSQLSTKTIPNCQKFIAFGYFKYVTF